MKSSGPSELGVVMRPGAMIRRPQKPAAQPTAPTTTQAVSTKIFLRGLHVVAQCGVYAHEKGHTRSLTIDVDVWVSQHVRASSDVLPISVMLQGASTSI
jgi:7,8-dihydroneopterin aldolase/epimerase/oxygenase